MISPVENRTISGRAHKKLRFGPFELSSRERVLRRGNEVLPLGSRALDILIYLAERPGQVIGKKELIDNVWPDVIVEEASLRVHVCAIRKALKDGQFRNGCIANIQGRGYSFVASVLYLDDHAVNRCSSSSSSSLDCHQRTARRPLRTKGLLASSWLPRARNVR
jgi:DNA-binding winged helix-turn-helix (wHTH) protein